MDRPRERKDLDLPFAIRVFSDGRQRLEPIRAERRVSHPQAERKRRVRGIELADAVVEARQPPFVAGEQLAHEAIRTRHLLADCRLPQRRCGVAAWRNDAAGADVEAAGKDGKGGGRPLVQERHDARMLGEVLQRLVIEPGETVAQQRGLTVGENRACELGRPAAAAEYRLAPDRRRQRNRDGLGDIGVRRPDTARTCRRDDERPSCFRDVVREARQLRDEALAIGGVDRRRAHARSRPFLLGPERLQTPARQRQGAREMPLQS